MKCKKDCEFLDVCNYVCLKYNRPLPLNINMELLRCSDCEITNGGNENEGKNQT